MFGKDLYSYFNNGVIDKTKVDEPILFKALNHAFQVVATKTPAVCRVIHGNVRQVSFSEKTFTPFYRDDDIGKPSVPCELADLLFVVVDRSSNEMRICCLQNKYDRNRKKHTLFSGVVADLRQLYLYKERPEFIDYGKRNSLLKDAICPSVGSYGVFYKTSSGLYDMKYYSSEVFRIPHYHVSSGRRTVYPTLGPLFLYHSSPSFGTVFELQYSDCMNIFGEALIGMLIGTPCTISKGLTYLNDKSINDAVIGLIGDDYVSSLELNDNNQFSSFSYQTAVVIRGQRIF